MNLYKFNAGDDVPEWVFSGVGDTGVVVIIKFGCDVIVEYESDRKPCPISIFPKVETSSAPLITLTRGPGDNGRNWMQTSECFRTHSCPMGDDRNHTPEPPEKE